MHDSVSRKRALTDLNLTAVERCRVLSNTQYVVPSLAHNTRRAKARARGRGSNSLGNGVVKGGEATSVGKGRAGAGEDEQLRQLAVTGGTGLHQRRPSLQWIQWSVHLQVSTMPYLYIYCTCSTCVGTIQCQ